MTRYQTDPSWWRRGNTEGDTVVAGSPLKVFRFSAAARSLLEAIENKTEVSSNSASTIQRLLDAGAVHPILDSMTRELQPNDVTVVIPVHNGSFEQLSMLVTKVSSAYKVLIIDDGSSPALPEIAGAQVIRRDAAGGPAVHPGGGEGGARQAHEEDAEDRGGRASAARPRRIIGGAQVQPRCAGAGRCRSTPGATR